MKIELNILEILNSLHYLIVLLVLKTKHGVVDVIS